MKKLQTVIEMKNKLIFFVIICCCFDSLSIQAQETIYVKFDRNIGDTLIYEEKHIHFFLNPGIDASSFQTESLEYKKICDLENKEIALTTIREFNQLVDGLLNKEAIKFEKKTGLKGNFIRNSYGSVGALLPKIYVYQPLTDDCGKVYEVQWMYAIE